jgi:hypothetical protein
MPEGFHPFPSRTRKLSPPRPMILLPRGSGKVGHCRDIKESPLGLTTWRAFLLSVWPTFPKITGRSDLRRELIEHVGSSKLGMDLCHKGLAGVTTSETYFNLSLLCDGALTRRLSKAHIFNTHRALTLGRLLNMAKLNVSIDDNLRDELFKLVPPRRRSQVVNEALRNELLRRKRQHATDAVRRLRKRSATLSGKEILDAVRKERTRPSR